MKYGTLTNLVYSEGKSAEPKVGNGATLLCWSDRHAYTIFDIKKNYVLVTRDIAERTDRNFENGSQEYIYKNDPDATPVRANLHKDGKYYIGNQVLKIGYRNEHDIIEKWKNRLRHMGVVYQFRFRNRYYLDG